MSQQRRGTGARRLPFFMHGCRVCLKRSPTSSCVWSAAAMLALLNASQAAQTCVPRGGRRRTCWADTMRGASGEGSGQVPGMSDDDTHEWLPLNTSPVNRDSRALATACASDRPAVYKQGSLSPRKLALLRTAVFCAPPTKRVQAYGAWPPRQIRPPCELCAASPSPFFCACESPSKTQPPRQRHSPHERDGRTGNALRGNSRSAPPASADWAPGARPSSFSSLHALVRAHLMPSPSLGLIMSAPSAILCPTHCTALCAESRPWPTF